MIKIVLVYKSGGDYGTKDVRTLIANIRQNTTIPYQIICLTDVPWSIAHLVDQAVPFKHDWPKWWGKIELFRRDLLVPGDRIFYMDLDTVVVNNIDHIIKYDGDFCMLQDFYKPENYGSALMSWAHGTMCYVYEKFIESPLQNMNQHRGFVYGIGDQGFIQKQLYGVIPNWQSVYPDEIVSYKVHCRSGIPETAKIVCFHGKPRPREVTLNFLGA